MKFIIFPVSIFCYKMAPNELKNGTLRCFSSFVIMLFRSKFFVKALSILLLSFTLCYFHKSGLTLLQEICLLVLTFTC